MGYQDDDRHGGGNRWRDRDDGRWNERGYGDGNREWRGSGRDDWNEGRREHAGWGPGWGGGGGDRGGRDGDDRSFIERAGEGVRSWLGGRDEARRRGGGDHRYEQERGGRQEHEGGSYGWMSGGWGNQAGESWNRDRPGVHEREGWFTDSVGGERGRRMGGAGGRESSPITRDHSGPSGGHHDPHYSEWRRRKIEELDRDYEEYRREHHSKFEQEFGGWRQKREGQRQMLGRVAEKMEVVGSDGSHVGTVDGVRGDRIVLTKSDENAGGMHHSVPCSWVENVDQRVTLNRTAEQAMSEWRDEERSRALFERQDSGSDGPHMLNRSFAGTYKDRDDDR
ncbi:MAG TPA: DUF2171 domain-containing protein [Allosphingosinicella sp.]